MAEFTTLDRSNLRAGKMHPALLAPMPAASEGFKVSRSWDGHRFYLLEYGTDHQHSFGLYFFLFRTFCWVPSVKWIFF